MKTVLLAGLTMVSGAVHAASFQCFVVGQSSQNPNSYTKMLKHVPSIVLQGPGAAQAIYQTLESTIYLALNDQGKMAISVVEMPASKVSLVASGGADEVMLIDASKKISVICKQ